MKNVSLFKAEYLPPRVRYEKLFENLPPLLDLPKTTGALRSPETPSCDL